jgi:predicted O-methyltransferase YrrM
MIKEIIKRGFNTVGIDVSGILHHRPPKRLPQEILSTLGSQFKTTLLSLYQGDPQKGFDGELHPIDGTTRIPPEEGMLIYNLCLSAKPESTLEIGLAYGFSTIYFLAAATKNQKGKHTAIDPLQKSHWHGIGLTLARTHAPKWEESFRFIHDRSDRAATDLLRESRKYDLIFIDGNHKFDDVLVDFYLYSQLCAIGGKIILDDMWMSSIQSAVSFIRKNRADFVEMPTSFPGAAVFQKISEDKRQWNEFVEFRVSKTSS